MNSESPLKSQVPGWIALLWGIGSFFALAVPSWAVVTLGLPLGVHLIWFLSHRRTALGYEPLQAVVFGDCDWCPPHPYWAGQRLRVTGRTLWSDAGGERRREVDLSRVHVLKPPRQVTRKEHAVLIGKSWLEMPFSCGTGQGVFYGSLKSLNRISALTGEKPPTARPEP